MEQKDFSFKKYAWQQFKKNKPALISLYILAALIFVALFAPIIANDQPLYCKYKGEKFFPAFSTLVIVLIFFPTGFLGKPDIEKV